LLANNAQYTERLDQAKQRYKWCISQSPVFYYMTESIHDNDRNMMPLRHGDIIDGERSSRNWWRVTTVGHLGKAVHRFLPVWSNVNAAGQRTQRSVPNFANSDPNPPVQPFDPLGFMADSGGMNEGVDEGIEGIDNLGMFMAADPNAGGHSSSSSSSSSSSGSSSSSSGSSSSSSGKRKLAALGNGHKNSSKQEATVVDLTFSPEKPPKPAKQPRHASLKPYKKVVKPVGMHHHGNHVFAPSDVVQLLPDPTNLFDSNAIKIIANGLHVGHVAAKDAVELKRQMGLRNVGAITNVQVVGTNGIVGRWLEVHL